MLFTKLLPTCSSRINAKRSTLAWSDNIWQSTHLHYQVIYQTSLCLCGFFTWELVMIRFHFTSNDMSFNNLCVPLFLDYLIMSQYLKCWNFERVLEANMIARMPDELTIANFINEENSAVSVVWLRWIGEPWVSGGGGLCNELCHDVNQLALK